VKSTKPLGASIVLEDVRWQGLGNCVSRPSISSQNFQPVLRNPVDLINATYGQLLSYVVPEVNNFDYINNIIYTYIYLVIIINVKHLLIYV